MSSKQVINVIWLRSVGIIVGIERDFLEKLTPYKVRNNSDLIDLNTQITDIF